MIKRPASRAVPPQSTTRSRTQSRAVPLQRTIRKCKQRESHRFRLTIQAADSSAFDRRWTASLQLSDADYEVEEQRLKEDYGICQPLDISSASSAAADRKSDWEQSSAPGASQGTKRDRKQSSVSRASKGTKRVQRCLRKNGDRLQVSILPRDAATFDARWNAIQHLQADEFDSAWGVLQKDFCAAGTKRVERWIRKKGIRMTVTIQSHDTDRLNARWKTVKQLAHEEFEHLAHDEFDSELSTLQKEFSIVTSTAHFSREELCFSIIVDPRGESPCKMTVNAAIAQQTLEKVNELHDISVKSAWGPHCLKAARQRLADHYPWVKITEAKDKKSVVTTFRAFGKMVSFTCNTREEATATRDKIMDFWWGHSDESSTTKAMFDAFAALPESDEKSVDAIVERATTHPSLAQLEEQHSTKCTTIDYSSVVLVCSY